MKPILIIGIILIVLATIAVSKQRIDLNDYEEECYQYQLQTYLANFSFYDYKDGNYCMYPYAYYGLNCTWIKKYYFYNTTRFTDICIKYHLVRRV